MIDKDAATKRYALRKEQAKQAFETNPRVFVYGSLKEGWGNHATLGMSKLIDETVSEDSFALGDIGFPYAFAPDVVPDEYRQLLFPVMGEMYEVHDANTFSHLDALEGYPSHYTRRIFNFTNGVNAWMYIQPEWDNAKYCRACTLEEGIWSWP